MSQQHNTGGIPLRCLFPGGLAGERAVGPTRQALFPLAGNPIVSLAALKQAEVALHALGFEIVRRTGQVWEIHFPGSSLRVWRYSAAEVCEFARIQARRYAIAAMADAGRPATDRGTGRRSPATSHYSSGKTS